MVQIEYLDRESKIYFSYGAVPPEMRFNKLPYEQTSPGNRAANAEEVKIQDWAEQYR